MKWGLFFSCDFLQMLIAVKVGFGVGFELCGGLKKQEQRYS